jgi:hypothetical protein
MPLVLAIGNLLHPLTTHPEALHRANVAVCLAASGPQGNGLLERLGTVADNFAFAIS